MFCPDGAGVVEHVGIDYNESFNSVNTTISSMTDMGRHCNVDLSTGAASADNDVVIYLPEADGGTFVLTPSMLMTAEGRADFASYLKENGAFVGEARAGS